MLNAQVSVVMNVDQQEDAKDYSYSVQSIKSEAITPLRPSVTAAARNPFYEL